MIFLLSNGTGTMSPGTMSRPSTSVFLTGTAVVIGAWLFLKKTSKKRVPYAPAGMLETLVAISGPTSPWFMLDMFQRVKKTGRLSFRLALPALGMGFFVTGDFNLAREVLKDSTTDKIADNSVWIIMGKHNLFTSQNNAHWKFVRKATVPAFSASEVGRMNEIAVHHIDNWFRSALEPSIKEGQSFDVNKEMCKLTFQVICEAGFEYIPSTEEFEKFEHHLHIALDQFTFKYQMNPLRKIFGSFIPEVREGFASCREVQKLAGRLLDAYRKNPNKSPNNTLIKLIADNDSFDSDAQRIAEIVVYLIAGHDT
jgi:cytochrome P450